MLVVISPAKSLDFDSSLPQVEPSQPLQLDRAQILVEQLKGMSPHQVSDLMRISDKLGTLNYDRFQTWHRPFTADNARPAVLTFNGDVYQGLRAQDFNQQDFAFAQDHLCILSGLYGVLRPLDLIQPYRLEMGTRLQNPAGRDLYAFWTEAVTQHIDRQLQKVRAKALVNLASAEYFKAVKANALAVPVIEPVFKDFKNGQYKIINFFAKKARGLMSAYIIKNRLTDCEALKAFDWAGYGYAPEFSSTHKWVFTRKE